jgi:acetoin utilization deacetylase AcuC-like enzyme
LPALVFDRAYAFAFFDSSLDPLRAEKILTALELLGLLHPADVTAPAPASLRDLLRVHDRDYLEALSEAAPFERAFGVPLDDTQRGRALTTQRAMTGGTLAAARLALSRHAIVYNLGGGFHHARRDRGQGFCLFNDVAVAVAALRRGGFDGRVLVVDLDLHDGDGTRAIFATDPLVHTYSVHNRPWDDAADLAVGNTAIELGTGVGDERYLATVRDTLAPVVAQHRPDLVFYLAGCDPAGDDRIGDWKISAEGMLARDRLVLELVRGPLGQGKVPLVVLLAGGYGERSWRHTTRTLAWLGSGGETLELPGDDEVLVARYRSIARLLSPAELSGESETESWGLTEEDLFGSLQGRELDARLLGFYPAHGVELVLESSGIFDRLRDLGYETPVVDLDLSRPDGHMVRIWGQPQRRELLGEIRMRRDRQSYPGCELLAIEWLLLQNPRAPFTPERPPLPGQRHPGLGLLRDVLALLVQVCHRLHLDGITYTPSHFHLASQSTKYLFFREPADAATFDAVRAALAGLPLAEASRLVAAGKVVDAATGRPYAWRPLPMVLAVSDALVRAVEEDRHEERRAEARAAMSFRIAT